MDQIPSWVWVLLAHVEEYEDFHGANDCCIDAALKSVPAEARIYGRAYIMGRAEALREVARSDDKR